MQFARSGPTASNSRSENNLLSSRAARGTLVPASAISARVGRTLLRDAADFDLAFARVGTDAFVRPPLMLILTLTLIGYCLAAPLRAPKMNPAQPLKAAFAAKK